MVLSATERTISLQNAPGFGEQFVLYLGGACCHEQRSNWLLCYYVYYTRYSK